MKIEEQITKRVEITISTQEMWRNFMQAMAELAWTDGLESWNELSRVRDILQNPTTNDLYWIFEFYTVAVLGFETMKVIDVPKQIIVTTVIVIDKDGYSYSVPNSQIKF